MNYVPHASHSSEKLFSIVIIVFINCLIAISAAASNSNSFDMYIKYQVGTYSGEIVDFGAEALDFADTNGDGNKDIIISTTGRIGVDPISPDDPRISIIHLTADFVGELANTSRLEPSGWINDFIFTDQDSDGYLEIIGNDHGRELRYHISDWNVMKVYEWEPSLNAYIEHTDKLKGNDVNFYHGMYGSGDVNGDGYDDIFVGSLSALPHTLLTGHPENFFVNSTAEIISEKRIYRNFKDEMPRFTSAGVAGVFDYGGDGDYDLISLPYDIKKEGTNLALIFEFEGGNFKKILEFDPRSGKNLSRAQFKDINSSTYGFSTIRFGDINNDGLQDIVAYAENPSQARGEHKGAIVSMIQEGGGMTSFKAIPEQKLYFNLPTNDPYLISTRGGIPMNSEISLIDLDGDGDLDLFVPPYFDGNPRDLKYSLFFNDGTGEFFHDLNKSKYLLREVSWMGGARVAVSDFNGDSIADYVVIDSDNSVEPKTKANEFGTRYYVDIFLSNADRIRTNIK